METHYTSTQRLADWLTILAYLSFFAGILLAGMGLSQWLKEAIASTTAWGMIEMGLALCAWSLFPAVIAHFLNIAADVGDNSHRAADALERLSPPPPEA